MPYEGGYSVGSAFLTILPSFKGIAKTIDGQAAQWGKSAGAKFGDTFNAEVLRRTGNAPLGPSDSDSTRQGSTSGAKFADGFKAKVTAALRSLPDAKIGAETSEADQKIKDLRVELEALSNKTIGVDISADDAVVAIDDIKARLDELGAKSPSIQVRTDALDASAKLEEINAQVDRLDGKTATVNVKADTSQAEGALAGLSLGGGGLGTLLAGSSPLLAPLGAAGLAGGAGITTALASGAAGLGVLGLAASGVSSAMKDLTQQQSAEASAAGSSASASVGAANRIASAQAALAQAREVAGNQAITSAQAVASAEQSLGNTETQVAQQRAQAAQTVANAEYSLTQANQQAANAQNALNTARETAARDLESAADRQVDANLNLRQSQISLVNAQQSYQQALANPKTPALQLQQDALDVAKAQQALVEAQQEVTNATEDNTAAQAAGVAGAPGVVSATQAVASATHGQQQAVQGLAAAQAAQAQQAITGAQQIAAAEQALANARRAQSQQAEQSAYSITSAQRSLASAMDATGSSGSTSLAKINAQLAELSPATVAFAQFVQGTLEPAFRRMQGVAAAGLLPGVQQMFEELTPLIPPFTTFIGDLATTMGSLFAQAGKALQSPFWHQFFDYVSATASPTIVTMGKVIGDLATGFAGLLEAFQPVTDKLGNGILDLAGKFADFGKNLSTNSGFHKFLDYVEVYGPIVANVIGNIAVAAGHLIVALAPLGGAMLRVVDAVARLLASLSPGQLLGAITAVSVALVALFAILAPASLPITLVVVAITALGGSFAYAYTHSKTFHDFIRDHVLPILEQIWSFIMTKVVPVMEGILTDALHGAQAAFEQVSGAVQAHRSQLEQLLHAFEDIVGFVVQYVLPLIGPILKSAFEGLGEQITLSIDVVAGLVDGFNWLVGTGKSVAHWFANDFVDAFTGAWSAVSGGAKGLWSDISRYFTDGVNDVINVINGLIGAADDVLGFFGLKGPGKIPPFNQPPPASKTPPAHGGVSLNNQKLMATGGLITNTPVAIVGEGGPHPEWVIPTDPAYRQRALGLYASLGTRLMAGGGVIGDIWGGITGFGRAIASKGVSGALSAVESPVKALIGAIPVGSFRDLASALLDRVNSAIVSAVGGGAKSSSGTGGVGQWASTVAQALALLGQPQSLAAAVLRRIGFESGGNPDAVNRTDSNWVAGHPSVGLMQVIRGTFAGNAGPFAGVGPFAYGVSENPLANIFAGLHYALGRYGSIAAIDPLVRPMGYDDGGYLPAGLSLNYNGTGTPEPVLSSSQWAAIGSGGSATLIELKALRAEVHALRGDTQRVGPSAGAHVGAALNGVTAGAQLAARGGRF